MLTPQLITLLPLCEICSLTMREEYRLRVSEKEQTVEWNI
jgi:hypothetical protein